MSAYARNIDFFNEVIQASGKPRYGIVLPARPIGFGFEWSDIGDAIKNAGGAVAKAFRDLAHYTEDGLSSARDYLRKNVPVIGPALGAIVNAIDIPWQVLDQVMDGVRIDKVIMRSLEQSVMVIRDLGPWVVMVISFIPGIGQLASAIISGAVALANGQPIDEAAAAAIAGAIPGGAFAKPLYHAARTLITTGKILLTDLVSATFKAFSITLPAVAMRALSIGVRALEQVVNGQDFDKATIEALNSLSGGLLQATGADKELKRLANPKAERKEKLAAQIAIADALTDIKKLYPHLPPKHSKAYHDVLSIAASVAKARQIQKKLNPAGPALALALSQVGERDVDPVTRAARSHFINPWSFNVGLGIMHYRVTPAEFVAVRESLTNDQKKQFDLATAYVLGKSVVAVYPPQSIKAANATAAYFITIGLHKASPETRAELLVPILYKPGTEDGIYDAWLTLEIKAKSVWKSFVDWIHKI